MKTINISNELTSALNLINGAEVKVTQVIENNQITSTITSTVKLPTEEENKILDDKHLSINVENDSIIFNYRENNCMQRFTIKKSFLIKIAKAIYSIVDCFENIHRYIKLEVFDPKSNTFKKKFDGRS